MNKWLQLLKGLFIITILVVIGIGIWWLFETYPDLLYIISVIFVIFLFAYAIFVIGNNVFNIFKDWFGSPPATT